MDGTRTTDEGSEKSLQILIGERHGKRPQGTDIGIEERTTI
jgi:phosphosulfolactate phosphohydrolase-like enzyme